MKKAVVVLSGGLDSTTLLHYVISEGYETYAISFNYGQRHYKELWYADHTCRALRIEHQVIDLTDVTKLFKGSGSSLVTGESVPEGHYGEESMKATVVPNRNMMMFSIAAAWAVSIKADRLFVGVHAGDHFIYPDCRPEFLTSLAYTITAGNEGFIDEDFAVMAPFINQTKNDIAERAFALQVDIGNTWSCYKGGDIHCGKCGTCVERIEAIASTGRHDPTTYRDETFWLEALKRDTV